MKRVAVAVVCMCGLLAVSALARTPLPPKGHGAGREPMSGGGVLAGTRFSARSAIVEHDGASGDFYVYLFRARLGCHAVSYSDAPYVWVWVHTQGTPLDVSRPMRTSGTSRFVQVNFVLSGHYVAIQPGVRLTLTHIDPARGSLWHGRLLVTTTTYQGKRYSYSGTFVARLCQAG